ncbi:tigger transposable element-derived protein 6-like [Hydractinia symbiolongicarpus]|uniref:tigger transposable element-derived protein 6-like n=1 Tax=Hydractinia symbiolongicarpus TaxID=13093 RepID=UPI00254AEDF7|nr:tigger transposable element-derived protein 6-like [Hydractinia symbiolongicarpus]
MATGGERLSKQQLAGKFQKKTFTLDEKIKFLDFAKKNPKFGCRKLADIHSIGKTAAATILKNEKKIRTQYEMFREKNKKRDHHGKYHKLNEILFEWYQRCAASNIYPNGVMLKEEVIAIKEQLKSSEFDDFKASDGWLDRWKSTFSIKERRIVGEAGDVSTEAVSSWIERVNELIEGYSLDNIWNMDESGCFFKALPDKGLVSKGKQAKSGKKSKQRLTVAFFVNAAGERVDEPIIIWKSKSPRCFKRLKDPSRPADVHYFSNPQSWMTSDVMETVLTRFNRKLVLEDRKVILFLDNAPCHPESIIGQFSQIKIVFLPKNTTSRLQPLDAGIIQNFKVKYRKRFVKYVLARIQENTSETEIVKAINVLVAIRWIQDAWKEVSSSTIKNCFQKCGIKRDSEEIEENDGDDDLEFEALKVRDDSIDAICNREKPDDQIQEISDDDQDDEDNDDYGPEQKEQMSCKEIIITLDKMRRCTVFDEESQKMLTAVTKKIEDLQIKCKKQASIKDFFL